MSYCALNWVSCSSFLFDYHRDAAALELVHVNALLHDESQDTETHSVSAGLHLSVLSRSHGHQGRDEQELQHFVMPERLSMNWQLKKVQCLFIRTGWGCQEKIGSMASCTETNASYQGLLNQHAIPIMFTKCTSSNF